MKLDKFTFGKSPAALYLALILNERDDRRLASKVARFLNDHRKSLGDLVGSYYQSDEMSVSTFGLLLNLMQKNAKSNALNFDEQIKNLLSNIISAEINVYKRRTFHATRLNQKLARGVPEGATVPKVKATPFLNEESLADRNEQRIERSRAYLARKGKLNTLY